MKNFIAMILAFVGKVVLGTSTVFAFVQTFEDEWDCLDSNQIVMLIVVVIMAVLMMAVGELLKKKD